MAPTGESLLMLSQGDDLHLQSFKNRMVQISQEFNLAPLSLYQQLER
jgi:hypothetical protein